MTGVSRFSVEVTGLIRPPPIVRTVDGGHRNGEPGSGSKGTRRLVVASLTLPLLGAAVLWWVAGSNMTMARWISLIVIVVALGGWFLSRGREGDDEGGDG